MSMPTYKTKRCHPDFPDHLKKKKLSSVTWRSIVWYKVTNNSSVAIDGHYKQSPTFGKKILAPPDVRFLSHDVEWHCRKFTNLSGGMCFSATSDDCLLARDVVEPGRMLTTFRRIILLPSSGLSSDNISGDSTFETAGRGQWSGSVSSILGSWITTPKLVLSKGTMTVFLDFLPVP